MDLYESTLLQRSGEYEGSIDLLEQIVAGFVDNEEQSNNQLSDGGKLDLYIAALNNLAFLYATHRDDGSGEAMESVTKALAVAPRQYQAPILDTLSLIEFKNGNCEKARSAIESAIEIQADNTGYRIRLAEILLRCNQYNEADVVSRNIQEMLLSAPEADIKKLDRISELRDEIRTRIRSNQVGGKS
jgi:lipopolysaccharide biosynthesis regulator YciM